MAQERDFFTRLLTAPAPLSSTACPAAEPAPADTAPANQTDHDTENRTNRESNDHYVHPQNGAPQTPSAPTASAVRAAAAALAPRDNPIFAVAARAAALRAQGIDVITLAAGEPDTPTAAGVVHAAQRAAADPALHHYGPAAGVPTDVEQVQVTLGAKHALFTALAGLTTPGDAVLVVTPGWPGHTEVVTAARATPVQVAAANPPPDSSSPRNCSIATAAPAPAR